ncbi:LptM family lipoprotein [Aminipila sp.]|uniref:LptM family lipoprotein n=1 Tax=Aminipila sp. TaxID=2060095 RepID=UPI00289DA6D2|nr:hypothetical protein [Aminipila sp.]
MKRILSLIVIATLAFGLAGCVETPVESYTPDTTGYEQADFDEYINNIDEHVSDKFYFRGKVTRVEEKLLELNDEENNVWTGLTCKEVTSQVSEGDDIYVFGLGASALNESINMLIIKIDKDGEVIVDPEIAARYPDRI